MKNSDSTVFIHIFFYLKTKLIQTLYFHHNHINDFHYDYEISKLMLV